MTEEEVTTTAPRTDSRNPGPSEAVLDARKRANHARYLRDKASRKVGPMLSIARRNVPVLASAFQEYTQALKAEAASYRHLARALAADLARLEEER